MDHDPLIRREHEARLRREVPAVDRDVQRAAGVAGAEALRRPDVEDRPAAASVHWLERLRRADKGSSVQCDDPLHVRRPHAGPNRIGDELVLVCGGKRVVEAPLEADRRRSLRAHSGAAERARDMAGIDLNAVVELQQPLKAVIQVVRPFGGL
jgi:hypothetical protein